MRIAVRPNAALSWRSSQCIEDQRGGGIKILRIT